MADIQTPGGQAPLARPFEPGDGSMCVRPMRQEELTAVRAISRQVSLSSTMMFSAMQFFSWKPDVLVAEYEGRLVGGAVLGTYPLPRGRTAGFVSWIFTAPEARGLGAGQRLIEAALELFEARGYQEAGACVEGYNTSSSKLFATRGFGILSPGEQFRRYGWLTPLVWGHTSHLMDVGHFYWARPRPQGKPRPALQWAVTAILSAGILALALWRQAAFGRVQVPALAAAMVAVPTVYALRQLGMVLAAKAQGIRTEYRAWESGLTLGLGLALAFGQWLPAPGSLYPAGDRWTYREVLPRWAPLALAGVLPVLALAWAMWGLARWDGLPPEARLWVVNLRRMAVLTAFFDSVMAFFPFVSYNGRRLWDWNRLVWAVVAAPALVLLFV